MAGGPIAGSKATPGSPIACHMTYVYIYVYIMYKVYSHNYVKRVVWIYVHIHYSYKKHVPLQNVLDDYCYSK